MNNQSASLYDLVPIKNPTIYWEMTPAGYIRLQVEERGFVSTCKKLITGAPVTSQIVLDKFGSFIWVKMDGRHTVEEIGTMLYQQFGEETEPLEERLEDHFSALRRHRLIVF